VQGARAEEQYVLQKSSLALLLASTFLGCAGPHGAEEVDQTDQQLTVAEPMRGMYHWDAPNGPTLSDAAASWLGREHDVALAFAPRATFSDLTGPSWQLPAWGNWVKAKAGRKLVYAVALVPDSGGTLQQCADGAYDATWKTLANNLVANGLGDSILRLGWEFDGDWFAWSARGKETQYAGCFKRAVSAMRSAQPTAGLKFDWNPTEDIGSWSSAQIDAAYPGDAYVDFIGVDAYDTSWAANSYPYPATCDAACRTLHQTNGWNEMSHGLYVMRDYAVAHNKQLSIPEWGVWTRPDGHGGGDNPLYVQKMHDFMTDPQNRVGYQIYFDVNYSDGAHQLSDVSGDGGGSTVSHTFQTAFADSANKFRTLFGTAPAVVDAGVPVVTDAALPVVVDAGAPGVVDAGGSISAPSKSVAIVNPGFESGSSGWYLYGSSAIGKVGVHSGAQDLQIAGGVGGAEQDVNALLVPGASYKLSVYARLYKSGEQASLGMKFLSGSGTVLSETYAMITSTSFTQRSITFTVPQGAARALIYAYKQKGNSTGALFDDYTLVRQ
jgi:hypothetical protein